MKMLRSELPEAVLKEIRWDPATVAHREFHGKTVRK